MRGHAGAFPRPEATHSDRGSGVEGHAGEVSYQRTVGAQSSRLGPAPSDGDDRASGRRNEPRRVADNRNGGGRHSKGNRSGGGGQQWRWAAGAVDTAQAAGRGRGKEGGRRAVEHG